MPRSIIAVCWSGFFLYLGWGVGADLLFGYYLQTIVGSLGLVGLFAAILSVFKLLATVPMGYVDSKLGARQLIIAGKSLYILASVGYMTALAYKSWMILLGAMMCNGLATALTLTTYQMIIRDRADVGSQQYGYVRYVLAINIGYAVGGFLAYGIIDYVTPMWLFVGIIVGSLIGLLRDMRLPLIHYSSRDIWDVFALWVYGFVRITQSMRLVGIVYQHAGWSIFFQSLFSLLDYVLLIFLPLLLIQQGYGFTQIALMFAVMRLPYIASGLSVYWVRIMGTSGLTITLYLLIGVGFILLGTLHSFEGLLIVIGCMSLLFAWLRPTVLGSLSMVSSIGAAQMTGLQELVSRGGEILGAILMGVCASRWGLSVTMNSIGYAIMLCMCRYALSRNIKKSSGI